MASKLRLMILATIAAGMPALAQQSVSPQTQQRITFIHAGQMLDRPGDPPRGNSTIVVRGRKIVEIRDGFSTPEPGARLLDLSKRFVMPGLIDLHVHLIGPGGDPLKKRLTAGTRDSGDNLLYAVRNARVTLDAGFTTVRDMGGSPRGLRALQEAIERGDIAGPTVIHAARMLSVTGGHGDGSNGGSDAGDNPRQSNICDSAEDCRRAVRGQVGLGAQVIKFAATGGVLSNVSGGLGTAMVPEEMRAIVDTAHSLGRKVAAHSHAAEGTRIALEAGVDSIEHGTFIDDETVRLFKAKDAWLVPTMLAAVTALEQARAGQLPPAVVPKAEAAAASAMDSHRRAIAGGVKIAFGTDASVSPHGENAREFALMVKAGMTPAAALRAATVSAAEVIGNSEIGTIEPGKDADIIAVEGDPLQDVTRMERVRFVMRRGTVHRQDEAATQ